MKEINVKAQKRETTGKKATKLMRKEGLVPCNIYGETKDENGKPSAEAFAIAAKDLRKIIYTPHVYVVNIELEGKVRVAVIKEIQFHPTTDAPLHVIWWVLLRVSATVDA